MEHVRNMEDILKKGVIMKVKLYELPEYQNIKFYIDDYVVIFDHLDGFYSYCWLENDKSTIVHIKATTQFEPYKDGYKCIEGEDNEPK